MDQVTAIVQHAAGLCIEREESSGSGIFQPVCILIRIFSRREREDYSIRDNHRTGQIEVSGNPGRYYDGFAGSGIQTDSECRDAAARVRAVVQRKVCRTFGERPAHWNIDPTLAFLVLPSREGAPDSGRISRGKKEAAKKRPPRIADIQGVESGGRVTATLGESCVNDAVHYVQAPALGKRGDEGQGGKPVSAGCQVQPKQPSIHGNDVEGLSATVQGRRCGDRVGTEKGPLIGAGTRKDAGGNAAAPH